jgi:hypothetical protein
MDISIRISNEASYYDGTTWHSAFQENLVLLLVEAYYGFVVGDKTHSWPTPRAPRLSDPTIP